VPASRSRTHEWKRCLHQLHDRGGSLEIAIAATYEADAEHSSDLIWRVRILQFNDTDLVVECPQTLGRELEIAPGIELIAVIAIGQNRWMFRTTNLGLVSTVSDRRQAKAMRLAIPEAVERCQRRNFYRVHIASLSLPQVDAWPLLDPRSVLLAERANELRGLNIDAVSRDEKDSPDSLALPLVGPKFSGLLMNIGGGGIGLALEPADAAILHHHRTLWLRFPLSPEIPAPVCATAKVVHTHIDSTQRTYAGLSFDFSHNPAHQRFVVDQICRYISLQQKAQLLKQSA
jgi:c-di-GMP-binding flagellar brake protein YcgR